MTRILSSFRICLLAAVAVFTPATAWAWPFGPEQTIAAGGDAGAAGMAEAPYELAQADCSGAAAEAAARTGGQVLSVSSRNEGGQIVCEVTVLVPGGAGERPRKTTITIRQ